MAARKPVKKSKNGIKLESITLDEVKQLKQQVPENVIQCVDYIKSELVNKEQFYSLAQLHKAFELQPSTSKKTGRLYLNRKVSGVLRNGTPRIRKKYFFNNETMIRFYTK